MHDFDKHFNEELRIAYEDKDELTFSITNNGGLSFLRRYNELDIDIYDILEEVVSDKDEYEMLKHFLESGSLLPEQIIKCIPLCG